MLTGSNVGAGGILLLEGSFLKPPWRLYWGPRMIDPTVWYIYRLCSGVHIIDLPVHIRLGVGGKPSCSPRQFLETFVLDSPASGFDGGKLFSQKIAVTKRWTIISLDIHLKIMHDWEDRTRSLTLQLKRIISVTCSFLDMQFMDMTGSAISAHSSWNLLSACIRVVFKPHFRYSLLTCLIISTMFSIFRFLIILPVENILCRYMVFRNPISLE